MHVTLRLQIGRLGSNNAADDKPTRAKRKVRAVRQKFAFERNEKLTITHPSAQTARHISFVSYRFDNTDVSMNASLDEDIERTPFMDE